MSLVVPRSARRPLPRWVEIAVLPMVNVALAFFVVGIIARIIGVEPFDALKLLLVGAFGSSESIGYTLYYATNFIFTGLAVAVAFHAGLFNIGGEGQAYIGGLGCGLAVLALDSYLPGPLLILLAIVAAAAFGAAWAAVPAWMQAWRGSHIVITTIMFNFVASALMVYLLVNVLIAPGSMTAQSRGFADSASFREHILEEMSWQDNCEQQLAEGGEAIYAMLRAKRPIIAGAISGVSSGTPNWSCPVRARSNWYTAATR